jgi:hypothetical protein
MRLEQQARLLRLGLGEGRERTMVADEYSRPMG